MKLPSTSRARFLNIGLIFAITLTGLSTAPGRRSRAGAAPARLSDQEFWKLSTELSEQDGVFRSDNLLSNELNFQYVIPDLLSTSKQGRVYLGVGPEQNFTYIAALKPSMVFIIDIRHGNLDVHLMYKALFELSKNRAEFVSKLFSRKQADALGPESTARQIFSAYLSAEPDPKLFDSTLEAIVNHLKGQHKFALSEGDIDGIEWALYNYYRFGPSISYNSSLSENAPAIVGATGGFGRGGGGSVSYAQLMMADDGARLVGRAATAQTRSYLASEENFAFLKDLETKNLLIPVVGDFGGSKAIRAVGRYLKSNDLMVSAFYLSNVEQYLNQDGKTGAFLANVGTLPLDEASTFIRSGGRAGRQGGRGGVLGSELGSMLDEVAPYVGR
jgi:hypothetical protein